MVDKKYPQYNRAKNAEIIARIKKEIPIAAVAEKMGFTVTQTGNYLSIKEHDSVRIYPETNTYARFSDNTGGSNIDFVMNFGDMKLEDAINHLKGDLNDIPTYIPKPNQESCEKSKKLTLPKATDEKYARTFAYLCKTRCLDSGIISELMKNKDGSYIYQDERNNVVFVGKDKDGKDAFATRRSTIPDSSFRGDISGSNQNIGFMVNNNAAKLYVTEAPIDAISIMTIKKADGQDYKNASYLAICGTGKTSSLEYHLKSNPEIKQVVLACDNDIAGKNSTRKMLNLVREKFSNVEVSYLAFKGNDINEFLCGTIATKDALKADLNQSAFFHQQNQIER